MTDENHIDFSLVLASSIHDMKNSLSMLLHSLDQMYGNKKPKNEDEANGLAVLHYEASRVNNDLIQLLGLYRLQKNQLPLFTDEHFVYDLLEEQVVKNNVLLTSRDITATIDCDDAFSWYFDHDLLAGVINNMLVNAIRYTKNQVKLSAAMENDHLVIKVADNGTGYPELMLKDPMGHMKGIDFHSGSTSLGLYFAGEAAKLHKRDGFHGNIHLENGGELKGGIFQITIP